MLQDERHPFEGIGALSAGASSRLLQDGTADVAHVTEDNEVTGIKYSQLLHTSLFIPLPQMPIAAV